MGDAVARGHGVSLQIRAAGVAVARGHGVVLQFAVGGHMLRDGGVAWIGICAVPVVASLLKHWLRTFLRVMRW